MIMYETYKSMISGFIKIKTDMSEYTLKFDAKEVTNIILNVLEKYELLKKDKEDILFNNMEVKQILDLVNVFYILMEQSILNMDVLLDTCNGTTTLKDVSPSDIKSKKEIKSKKADLIKYSVYIRDKTNKNMNNNKPKLNTISNNVESIIYYNSLQILNIIPEYLHSCIDMETVEEEIIKFISNISNCIIKDDEKIEKE